MSPSQNISDRKSYGRCARSGCQTLNVLGIPRHREKSTSIKLIDFYLKLQTACSADCHEVLESDANELYRAVPQYLRQQSIQSPCQQCQTMVSTGSRTLADGIRYRAPKPLHSRGTFCGYCRKVFIGDVFCPLSAVLIRSRCFFDSRLGGQEQQVQHTGRGGSGDSLRQIIWPLCQI